MTLTEKMQKGFLSLEYILLIAGVLSCLALLSTGIINLYHRNINEIDNQRLRQGCKEINQTIELLELMPEGVREIELNNLFTWQVTRKSSRGIILKNKQKDCNIASRITIESATSFEENHVLRLTKTNNYLNIG